MCSWLSAQVFSSNWTLWLSAQDYCQATGHSSYPHRSPQVWVTRYPRPRGPQQPYPHKFPQHWTHQGPYPGRAGADHGNPHSRSQALSRPLHGFFWAPGDPHKFPQATGHLGCPHRIYIQQLGTPIIRTRVPRQLDTPIVFVETMVPGHWALEVCIRTSVSLQWG